MDLIANVLFTYWTSGKRPGVRTFEFHSLTFNNQSCETRKGHLMGLCIGNLCTLYSVYANKTSMSLINKVRLGEYKNNKKNNIVEIININLKILNKMLCSKIQ